jgi:hypothetical protein
MPLEMRRRGFIAGLAAALAAPAVIRTPGILMPVRAVPAQLVRYADLMAITHRAFVPRLFVDIYAADPLLKAIWESVEPVSRAKLVWPSEYLDAA